MRFSELDGATVGVWGAGREIGSFATQLQSHLPSARIAVAVDDAGIDLAAAPELASYEPRCVGAGDAVEALTGCDLLVRSPGVSIYRDELTALRGRGTPVVTATGLWMAEHGGENVIGITGTKGKSTTAALAAHLSRAAGCATHIAGNIGVPALDLLGVPDDELVVVELSSYQIADLANGPEIAVLTNLYPEHVHWHGTHDVYYADKLRLFELPGVRACALNGRDSHALSAFHAPAATLYGIPDGWDVSPDGLARDGQLAVPAADLPLRGKHNALNLCAALTALELAGVDLPELPAALGGFVPLPHRLEPVVDSGDVVWVDDSISTTPESTLAAMESFRDRQIVLIAGGQDRGQQHEALARELAARDAAVLGLPITGSALVAAARSEGLSDARAREVADMDAAVALARELAGPGSAVLLSPAAPSYNSYLSFEQRGDHFAALARG